MIDIKHILLLWIYRLSRYDDGDYAYHLLKKKKMIYSWLNKVYLQLQSNANMKKEIQKHNNKRKTWIQNKTWNEREGDFIGDACLQISFPMCASIHE
jgi:hypothetical protein